MRTYNVAIDVGHADGTGAAAYGVQEHELCAGFAPLLKAHLEGFKTLDIKAEIVDFPDKSNSEDLSQTVRYINAKDFDVVVSLHCDCASKAVTQVDDKYPDGTLYKRTIWRPDTGPHGAHVCYYSKSGRRLAELIASRLCQQMPGRANKTVQRTDLYILRRTNPVAVLVECGFISNPGDLEWMTENPRQLMLPIALGIGEYLEELNT